MSCCILPSKRCEDHIDVNESQGQVERNTKGTYRRGEVQNQGVYNHHRDIQQQFNTYKSESTAEIVKILK